MSHRFLLALAGLISVVGTGAVWLWVAHLKKKKLVQNLLSLPRERRFFWYLLKKEGYELLGYNLPHRFSILMDENEREFALQLDFLVKKNGRRFGCLFCNTHDERELMKIFFSYISVFPVDGILFFYEKEKRFVIWEW